MAKTRFASPKVRITRRRKVVQPPQGAGEDAQVEQHAAGADLLKGLLSLYGLCKLRALDFCSLCHWCSVAGVPGADFEAYAYPPGTPSSRYQAHLDVVLPPPGPFYPVACPQWVRGTSRQVRHSPTSCI